LVIEYAAVCKQNPKFSFFEATAKLAGVSEKPAPPAEPDQPGEPGDQTPVAPDRINPDAI